MNARVFLLWSTVLVASGSVYAQQQKQAVIIDSGESVRCERTSAVLDAFAQQLGSQQSLIVIAHNGANESRLDIGVRRLHNIGIYFSQYLKGTPWERRRENIVLAVSSLIVSEGRIDFFVDGRKEMTIHFGRNRDLDLSPCVTDTSDQCKDPLKGLYVQCKGKGKKKTLGRRKPRQSRDRR